MKSCADLAVSDEDIRSYQSCDMHVAWLCPQELSQALYLSTRIFAAVNGGWYYSTLGTVYTVAFLFAYCSILHSALLQKNLSLD